MKLISHQRITNEVDEIVTESGFLIFKTRRVYRRRLDAVYRYQNCSYESIEGIIELLTVLDIFDKIDKLNKQKP